MTFTFFQLAKVQRFNSNTNEPSREIKTSGKQWRRFWELTHVIERKLNGSFVIAVTFILIFANIPCSQKHCI